MEKTKKCPYCGEEILAIAKKCKHCNEWLDETEILSEAPNLKKRLMKLMTVSIFIVRHVRK